VPPPLAAFAMFSEVRRTSRIERMQRDVAPLEFFR
jgi:hypothetical protein